MPFIELGDAKIHYELSGKGPPVLLIQGVGVAGSGWRPQVEGLGERYQLLSFDNRGVGSSSLGSEPLTIERMAEDARALMDHVGWPSAHVVGHSMGGVIAPALALADAKRVRSLALLCTFSRGSEAAKPTPWIMWVGLRTKVGTAAMRRAAFLEILLPYEDHGKMDLAKYAGELAGLFGHDLASQPKVAFNQLRAMSRHDATSRLSELRHLPTLVVSGRHDKLARPAYGQKLAAAIPGSRYVEIEDAAHGAPIHRAEVINSLLAEHFAGRVTLNRECAPAVARD